jgi:hypothetical protein
VELDVVGRRVEQQRIVPELAEPSVAVETQESSHRAGLVVVIDVNRGRRLANGAESLLLL